MRRYFAFKKLIEASVNATTTTESLSVEGLDLPGFTFTWAGGVGLNGSFTLQCSFDNITWIDLPLGAVTMTGVSGSQDITVTENRYKYLRGVFTITAGSANFLVWYSATSKGN